MEFTSAFPFRFSSRWRLTPDVCTVVLFIGGNAEGEFHVIKIFHGSVVVKVMDVGAH